MNNANFVLLIGALQSSIIQGKNIMSALLQGCFLFSLFWKDGDLFSCCCAPSLSFGSLSELLYSDMPLFRMKKLPEKVKIASHAPFVLK